MAEFLTVCKVADVPDGEGKAVSVAGRPIAIFKVNDQFHAIDDVCPHMGASLAGGHFENEVVTCPWHAWRFRVTDGTWMNSPRVKVPCYATRVVGDEVQILPPQPKPSPTPSAGGSPS